MLELAVILFLVSLAAGFFGFTGVASTTRTIAKVPATSGCGGLPAS